MTGTLDREKDLICNPGSPDDALGLPVAHFAECHERVIRAGQKACLDAVECLQTDDDPLIRFLLALRDLPGRLVKGKEAHRFGMQSFLRLGREGDRVVRYGLIGRFWRADYGLESQVCTPEAFWSIRSASCRLLLTFEAVHEAPGRTRLVTRTVIYCPQAADRKKMARYWRLIRPVSGLIRQRLLRVVAIKTSMVGRDERLRQKLTIK